LYTIGADEKRSAADKLMGRLAKMKARAAQVWREEMRALAAFILVAFAITPRLAFVENNTAWFLRLYADGSATDRQMVETYLSNNQNGLSWANVSLAQQNRPKLYCAPEELVPTGSQLLELVRLQIKVDPRIQLLPFGFALLISMQATYPCK
jgi:hypothetical protein